VKTPLFPCPHSSSLARQEPPVDAFDHEKLDVYQIALEFTVQAEHLMATLPPGQGDRCDQLRRAGTSIVLNIAEGAGEFSKQEKARFYRMAKRSATECAGVIDIFRVLGLGEQRHREVGRSMLLRIVSMLIRLIRNLNEPERLPGSGKGRGE